MAKKAEWKLFLDDLRTPGDYTYLLATNVEEARQLVALYGMPHFISFDHDLGEDENGVPLDRERVRFRQMACRDGDGWSLDVSARFYLSGAFVESGRSRKYPQLSEKLPPK